MWEKFKSQLSAHPYLFGGVALFVLVVVWFGFGRSGGTGGGSSLSASEADAIAQTANANAQLTLAQDQVQIAGINAAAAQAINENNNAAATAQAKIAADQANYNADTATKLAGVQAGMQAEQDNMILASQNSVQSWLEGLEKAGLVVPSSLEVTGLTAAIPFGQTADTPAATPSPSPVRSATTPSMTWNVKPHHGSGGLANVMIPGQAPFAVEQGSSLFDYYTQSLGIYPDVTTVH